LPMDGVSTYLALIFGTLLSSQGTDASFVLTRETLSGFPPGSFPSVLRFRLYQTFSRSDFLGAFQVSAFVSRFPFRRFRLYQKFRAGLTGVSLSDVIGGSAELKFRDADSFSRLPTGQSQFQATVRIYLPTHSVSTVFAGRRGD
ncbi:hypothetical protein ABZX99_09915, partial [Streptomyces antibioticus]|uniref:hypothetical protein n=2 Tax=Streptomyces antibioticus TaxID=1890 RepID=UPI0033A51CAB